MTGLKDVKRLNAHGGGKLVWGCWCIDMEDRYIIDIPGPYLTRMLGKDIKNIKNATHRTMRRRQHRGECIVQRAPRHKCRCRSMHECILGMLRHRRSCGLFTDSWRRRFFHLRFIPTGILALVVMSAMSAMFTFFLLVYTSGRNIWAFCLFCFFDIGG